MVERVMVMMLHLVRLKFVCQLLDQVDNQLMSVWKNEMLSWVVISEYIYCVVCKQFDIGVDLARDVVNIDEEQRWAQYCSLWFSRGDFYPVWSFSWNFDTLVPIYQKVFDPSVSFSADTIIV